MKLEWRELGGGAALALCVERVMVAVVTGPHADGYTVMIKSTGAANDYPDLFAAKAAAERDIRSRDAGTSRSDRVRSDEGILASSFD